MKSLTKLETYLLNQDYKTRQGKPFSRFAIREIIMNPVYAKADEAMYQYLLTNQVRPFSDSAAFDGTHGVMAYNRTEQTKGRTTRKKPMEEWVVAVGEHDGIVSGEDWIAVQGLLDENRSKSYCWRAGQTNEALLSGLLHCRCGHCMRPKITNRTTADKLRYCRHMRGLEQHEVAAHVTLHRSTYVGYETSGVRDYYPLDKLSLLAELFGVPLGYLLDDYNAFL